MKLLVFTLLFVACTAAPLARPDDDDDDSTKSKSNFQTIAANIQPVSYSAFSPVHYTHGAHVIQPAHAQQIVQSAAVPVTTYSAAQVVPTAGAVKLSVPVATGIQSVVPITTYSKKSAGDSGESHVAQVVSTAGAVKLSVPVATGIQSVAPITTYSKKSESESGESHVTTFNVAASPALSTVNIAPASIATVKKAVVPTVGISHTPAVSGLQFAAAPAATYSAVQVAAPAVQAVQVAAPAAQAVQVASVPAVTTYKATAPAVAAIPTAITYQSEQTVKLPSKEVDVEVKHHTVHVPVERRVHYGVQNVVTGSKTTIHKPTLSAPAIAAPQVFTTKTHHAAPEVSVTHSEVTVEKKSPNYVDAPYDGGVVVQHAAPEYKQVDVPTPVEVPQPVPVAQPYAVPVAQPIKVKSAVKPVVNVDVHSVKTENVVTPVEYSAHHHVVAAPAVAQVAAPAVAQVAHVHPVKTTQHHLVSQAAVPVTGQAVTFGVAPAVQQRIATVGQVGAVTGQAVSNVGQAVGFKQSSTGHIAGTGFKQVVSTPQIQYHSVKQVPVQAVSGQTQFSGVKQIPVQQFQLGAVANQGFTTHQFVSQTPVQVQETKFESEDSPTVISYSAPSTSRLTNQYSLQVAPVAKIETKDW